MSIILIYGAALQSLDLTRSGSVAAARFPFIALDGGGCNVAKEKIDVQKFFTDPAYAEEATFMEQAFDFIIAKKKAKAEEDAKNNPPPAPERTFIQELFDGVTGGK